MVKAFKVMSNSASVKNKSIEAMKTQFGSIQLKTLTSISAEVFEDSSKTLGDLPTIWGVIPQDLKNDLVLGEDSVGSKLKVQWDVKCNGILVPMRRLQKQTGICVFTLPQHELTASGLPSGASDS